MGVKFTWMSAEDDEHGRNDESGCDLIALDVGAELDGIEAGHDHERDATEEGEMHKLDSA